MSAAEDFRAWIQSSFGVDPGHIIADAKWHRFNPGDTRHKSSKPARYMLHDDERPIGLFMDWRQEGKARHVWRGGANGVTVDRAEIDRRRAERRSAQDAGFARAAEEASAFWSKCTKINGESHPYLDAKGIPPCGSRIGNDPRFGLGKEPCVIVPVSGPDGQAMTLQAIRADGERRFWNGSTKDGGHFAVGNDDGTGPVVFCEGFSTAASISGATGWLAIMCLEASNMANVARWAGHKYHGRDLIVAGDDDWHLIDHPKVKRNVGREAAEGMARALGAKFIMPDMHGLVTDGGDDFNDVAREYGLDEVAQQFGATKEGKPELPLNLISPADWQGSEIPSRIWRLDDLVPDLQATLFTGAGASGKSLATQQLSTCVAMGLPFLGIRTKQAVAVYITCEDDADELHRRQDAICARLGVTLEQTRGKLFLMSLQGEIGNELATFDPDGTMHIAERFNQIVGTLAAVGAEHVTLDNTAHFFSGNENDRHQVAGFINLCNRIARDISGSVIMVGHPNKAGDSYSGSTAWENQVRSRLYLETPRTEDGAPIDPDMRTLRNEKANYSQRNKEISFFWLRGAFVLEEEMPKNDRDDLAATAQAANENAIFLRCLSILTDQRRNVSHSPNVAGYAPKVMAAMIEARGFNKAQLARAMERLFALGTIAAAQQLWPGRDRHPVLGLALRDSAGQ